MNINRIKKAIAQSPALGFKTLFQEFIGVEASGGILLLLMAVIALIWANSPWADSYFKLWSTKLTIALGSWQLSKDLTLWINDGLMAVFFFVVGLEIKREVLAGELASPRRAILPVVIAIGGMALPAAIYTLFNARTVGAAGWGIPMTTDIAFTLGVMALLGTRAPLALKVLLTALAIIDDIGAVLVIALFYSSDIVWPSLLAAAGIMLLLIALNRIGVSKPVPYALLGVALWLALLNSGVHATIAGVLLAMTIPARAKVNTEAFLTQSRAAIQEYEDACCDEEDAAERRKQAASHILELASESVESPLQRLEHSLHPWVTYVIMPIFALANAGIPLVTGDLIGAITGPVTLGVACGLLFGKTLGISLFSWIAVRLKLAELPDDVTPRQIIGMSFLAGIGFTMSLFIADLAFEGSALLNQAKLGILMASTLAGFTGWTILRTAPQLGEQAQMESVAHIFEAAIE